MRVVIVTGSRTWSSEDAVAKALRAHDLSFTPGPHFMLIHGDAPAGADLFAATYAAEHPESVVEFPVPFFDWLGKRGGPTRNRAMLAIAKALRARGHGVVVEAFSLGTSGTEHMIGLAKAAGLVVNEHTPLGV